MSNGFTFDYWTLLGIFAQGLFFSRFVVQWYQSEKLGKITVPVSFWILSLMGSMLTLVYALGRRDIVFVLAGVLQLGLYSRNLMLARRTQED